MANNYVQNPIRVSYMKDGEISSKRTASILEANMWFDQIAKTKRPAKMEFISTPANILIDAINWDFDNNKKFVEHSFRMDLKLKFREAGIDESKINILMTLATNDITNAVITRDKKTFTQLNGIGDKTAEKVISALYGRVTFGGVVIGTVRKQFHERPRMTLNTKWAKSGDPIWITDSVKKRWSNLENYAAALSNDAECIINVVSNIPELGASPYEPKKLDIADMKEGIWSEVAKRGIPYNGKVYVFIGHGTNAAKENSTLFCRKDYAEQVVKHFQHEVNKDWQLTDAKYVAYLIGLQAVYAEPVDLPFAPEDFEIFPSLIRTHKANIAKNHADGTVTFEENGEFKQNEFDGFTVLSISAKMQNILIDRLVARGVERMEAIRRVNFAIMTLAGHTMRVDNAAFKGVVYVAFDMQKYLHSIGVHRLHGRDIDDIVFFSDETVLKTPIGEGKAYNTKEDWCKAVREGFQYRKLLCEHELTPKDIPYQVIQAAHKATKETVEAFAMDQANEINALHTLENASKMLTKPQRALIGYAPEAANIRFFQERMKTQFYGVLDDAFSGKRTGKAVTSLLAPDVIAFAQHIAGKEVTGFIPRDCFVNFKMKEGEHAMWRNPVMDTGSLRVVKNMKFIPEEYKKFFRHFDTTMTMLSIEDENITRIRGDYDGDKGAFSDYNKLIRMFKEAHELFGDWLTDWDDLGGSKGIVTRESQLEYASRLCRVSDLGITCKGINMLYAGKLMDRVTGVIEHAEATYAEISNATTRANNQVDAGKHGAKVFKVASGINKKTRISDETIPLQPMAKNYRDMHDKMAKDLVKGASRKPLDDIAKATDPRYGTLDIYFGVLADYVDRTYHVDDIPTSGFDVSTIMRNPKQECWGMNGMIRKGRLYEKSVHRCIDEGLLQSAARRTAVDYEIISNENPDEKERNMSEDTFYAKVRVTTLAEFARFAEACGKTLDDAYDYVTWYMFTKCDSNYAPKPSTEEKDNEAYNAAMLTIRDQLWRLYWIVFGGMLEETIEMKKQQLADAIDMENVDKQVAI